jgi:hypothetical protein
MWVNGVIAREMGEDVPGAAAGRVLRSGPAAASPGAGIPAG